MTGSLHSVAAQAWNDGLENTYQLTSNGQVTVIKGTPLLLQRINEIYALDYLNNLSQTQEFTSAMAKSLGQKVNSVVGIVKDPVGTVQNLPKGASRFFGGIGDALKGGRSETEGEHATRQACRCQQGEGISWQCNSESALTRTTRLCRTSSPAPRG